MDRTCEYCEFYEEPQDMAKQGMCGCDSAYMEPAWANNPACNMFRERKGIN